MGTKSTKIKAFIEHLTSLKNIEDGSPILIGSRAAHYLQTNTTPENATIDWDIIATPLYVISWVTENQEDIEDITFVDTPKIETSASVILKSSSASVDFTIPNGPMSSSNQVLLYMRREPNRPKIAFPGDGECIVPSIDLLIIIKRAHLYYPVKWGSHVLKYHELLKQKENMQYSNPSLANLQSTIRQQLVKEGAILHASKRVASQLAPFSTSIDIQDLDTTAKKLQLVIEQLLPFKSTFSTVHNALEWACTTGSTPVADLIIENYPEIMRIGEVVWNVKTEDVAQQMGKMGLSTNFATLEYMKKGTNSLPPLSFSSWPLPGELSTLIFSFVGWSRTLQGCACVNSEWSIFFNNKKVWHQLYIMRWDPFFRDIGSYDWRRYYKNRCENNTFWEGPYEKHKPAGYTISSNNDLYCKFTKNLRSITGGGLIELLNKLVANSSSGKEHYMLQSELFGISVPEEQNPPKPSAVQIDSSILVKLERALQSSYVTGGHSSAGRVPESTELSISLYGLSASPEPVPLRVLCESGSRGNSRHAYFCVQMNVHAQQTRVLQFDRPQLMNLQFSKWGFTADQKGLLSTNNIQILDIPSCLAVALSIAVFPPNFRQQLENHYLHCSGTLVHKITA